MYGGRLFDTVRTMTKPTTGKSMASMDKKALLEEAKRLAERADKLEELVAIISRGKYMWESTFDAITTPVQIVSPDYKVVRANLALAGVAEDEIYRVIGRTCFEVFAGRTAPCVDCPVAAALERNAQTHASLGCVIHGLEFEASAYPLIPREGERAVVVHYRDVTDQRRLQREVIQQEKMAAIGILAGGVAHEINNPLGGIIAFAQLMKRDVKDDSQFLGDIEEIERAALRCKKIVADLLDFSRISKDREKKLIDVNVLLEKVFPFLQREMRSMAVELIFDASPNLPLVMGIPDRLQQVFINLLTNACHAMTKGGTLNVNTTVDEQRGQVVIVVRDTGHGIAKDICERIFDPFFTTKEPGKGTGLGLSISYRIVRDHNGEIECSPLDEGGAEFVVRLPSAEMVEDMSVEMR